MGVANFSGMLLHISGQNMYYNSFTAPPTKQSQFHQWTIGEVFYSIVIISKILGESNQSQIIDTSNKGIYTPLYTIYGKGTPSKVALFNFTDNPTGTHDIMGTITIASQVYIKSMPTPSAICIYSPCDR
ncbi:hypothetical protein H0H81_005259 [Sphagnurus paluster]|uniref:Uncharacterized protein n=1 Tax=Sphagnurus paluster TaxID=117069 RepID=A0A9P7FLE4_9AGAR|nr:hypothetical protein H0H81_005259 [Sphagnurus paluster]